ncbi:hypothetical protein SETIT_2G367300v2 [Setaria italica]|uniref:Uncharacterized protein n=1 Tax=Setaria italica TaxID=4555 RepID=A0A368Q700_SETIT|nr:hypothetical protein SETIT_2G367300v2 [Setaria italica]
MAAPLHDTGPAVGCSPTTSSLRCPSVTANEAVLKFHYVLIRFLSPKHIGSNFGGTITAQISGRSYIRRRIRGRGNGAQGSAGFPSSSGRHSSRRGRRAPGAAGACSSDQLLHP